MAFRHMPAYPQSKISNRIRWRIALTGWKCDKHGYRNTGRIKRIRNILGWKVNMEMVAYMRCWHPDSFDCILLATALASQLGLAFARILTLPTVPTNRSPVLHTPAWKRTANSVRLFRAKSSLCSRRFECRRRHRVKKEEPDSGNAIENNVLLLGNVSVMTVKLCTTSR